MSQSKKLNVTNNENFRKPERLLLSKSGNLTGYHPLIIFLLGTKAIYLVSVLGADGVVKPENPPQLL